MSAARRLFFLHVPKTAGTTIGGLVRANFGEREVYSSRDIDGPNSYWDIQRLLTLPSERRAEVRVFMGHHPFVVTTLLDEHFDTMTVLRDPTERALSWLRRHKDAHAPEKSLDEIYDDELTVARFVRNHQTKLFSMTGSDPLRTYFDTIEVDEDRLARAKANLATVSVVGFHEDLNGFLAAAAARFGWIIGPPPRRNVSGAHEASGALRRRIADDNRLDHELYEFARGLDTGA